MFICIKYDVRIYVETHRTQKSDLQQKKFAIEFEILTKIAFTNLTSLNPNYFKSNVFHHHFYLPEVKIHVQNDLNDHRVLRKLVLCLRGM